MNLLLSALLLPIFLTTEVVGSGVPVTPDSSATDTVAQAKAVPAYLRSDLEFYDSPPPDSASTATFGDPTLYFGAPEKPLWFYLDSLTRAAGWLPIAPQAGERHPKVSSQSRFVGLLEGFEVVWVDYTIQYSDDPKVDSLQRGSLFLLEIWPSLYHLIANFPPIDAPDEAEVLYFPEQDVLTMRWKSERDTSDYEWEQFWGWHRLESRPVNLGFAKKTQRALDEALPAGYYAPFAGRINDSTLCLTAPVYKQLDEFGSPTGGEVTVCYKIKGLAVTVESIDYKRKK